MTTSDIRYLPVSEQRYARMIQVLEQHPSARQWGRVDRTKLRDELYGLVNSADQIGPWDTVICFCR